MDRRWKTVAVLVLALVLLGSLVAGCQQQDTTDNQKEDEGQKEQADLRLQVVEDWAQSLHAVPITFAAEEEGCKNCHDGLTFTTTGGGFQPRMGGEATESAGATDGAEARDWVVATDCRVCHTAAGVDIAEEGSVDGIPSVDTAEGGRGALCMACHNGWHPAGPGREGNAAAPHYSVQADMLYGVNTMAVPSAATTATEADEATESPHLEVEDTCVGCHLAGEEANHKFVIEDFGSCEAKDCHDSDMTDGGDAEEDYDGDGQTEKTTAEVEGLMESLKAAINTAAGTTEFKSQQGDVVFTGKKIDTDDPAYAAAYNYLYVEKDKSRGIHNFKFTVKLLQDSIASVSAQ